VPRTIARVPAPASLSRPSIDGDVLVYAVAGRGGSRIRSLDLVTGLLRSLRRSSRGALLTQPALRGGRLLYVRATHANQQLLIGVTGLRSTARDRVLLRVRSTTERDSGHQHGYSTQGRLGEDRLPRPRRAASYMLWTTALTVDAAYVTRTRLHERTADILRLQL
jgi:hypothetical protein